MLTEIALSFFIGFVIGLLIRPQNKDLDEQKRIYEERFKEYESNIMYYKNLCKWHVEQKEKK